MQRKIQKQKTETMETVQLLGKQMSFNDISSQFLLAEFHEMGETWRHTDSRIETAINFYLTILAATLPATILLYQVISDFKLFVFSIIPVIGVVYAIGLLLANRIANTSIRKAEYQLAVNLIRRYYVDHDPLLANYVYFPLAQPGTNFEEKAKQLRINLHQLIYVIIGINSLLTSLAICGLIWLGASGVILTQLMILIGIVVFFMSVMLLRWRYQKNIKSYK
jgi:hypothetical protein